MNGIQLCVSHLHMRKDKGLISTDRSNKTTLLFTIPSPGLSRLQRAYLLKYLELVWTGRHSRRIRCHNGPGGYDSGATQGCPTVVA